jgi:hypothetical protein
MLRSASLYALLVASLAVALPPRPGDQPELPSKAQVYCSGIVSREDPPVAGYVISGEEAAQKLQFFDGDYVYLRAETGSELKTGEQFLVVRPMKDPTEIPWFQGQNRLRRRMGRLWADVGRVRIVNVGKQVAVGRVGMSCAAMERGDRLVAFEKRPEPELPAARPGNLFIAWSGRPIGRVVMAKSFRQEMGAGDVAYVNLGAGQGTRVGDRVRFYRFPGTEDKVIYSTHGTATRVQGFGHSAVSYAPGELPREILGEGVVLRLSATAATVLITYSSAEIDLGDYAELE